MSIINQDKPISSISNISKTSSGETWATIITAWATETRTWIGASKIVANISKLFNVIWDNWTMNWDNEIRTWDGLTGDSGITNINKPI